MNFFKNFCKELCFSGSYIQTALKEQVGTID